MGEIKISVIIPVYNVEKYIRQCLESVVSQSLKEIEIICINDGSTDNSLKILQEFSQKDKRITVIDKKNEGASIARNIGIEKSQGEYIYFIDSDDWIEIDAIEMLYKKCNGEDIVYSNLCHYNENTKKIKEEKIKCFINEREGKYFLINGEGVGPCNKLYKLSFLKENNLKFLENIIYEDLEFNFRCFFLSQKVKYVKNIGYNYRMERTGSIMTDVNIEKKLYSLKVIINRIKELQKIITYDSFSFLMLKLLEIRYLVGINLITKEEIEKNKVKELENEIGSNWKKLSELEKMILKNFLRERIVNEKFFYNINLMNNFYWKNHLISFKGFRRAIIGKILKIFKN